MCIKGLSNKTQRLDEEQNNNQKRSWIVMLRWLSTDTKLIHNFYYIRENDQLNRLVQHESIHVSHCFHILFNNTAMALPSMNIKVLEALSIFSVRFGFMNNIAQHCMLE